MLLWKIIRHLGAIAALVLLEEQPRFEHFLYIFFSFSFFTYLYFYSASVVCYATVEHLITLHHAIYVFLTFYTTSEI